MSDIKNPKNYDKSGDPNSWVIKNNEMDRLEDMRQSFKELNVFHPARNGKNY